MSARAIWTADQVALLVEQYPHEETDKLAELLGMTISQTYTKASHLGLKKSQAYLDSPSSSRLRRELNIGAAHRFQAGHTTWNKGMKGLQLSNEKNRFKKGHMPHNWNPVGHERLHDGYLQRKMTDTRNTRRDYVFVHKMLWIAHYGPVPKDHCVVFRDKNRQNIVIENLECISRAEQMRRNSYHNYPKEVAQLVQLRGALARKINRLETDHANTEK